VSCLILVGGAGRSGRGAGSREGRAQVTARVGSARRRGDRGRSRGRRSTGATPWPAHQGDGPHARRGTWARSAPRDGPGVTVSPTGLHTEGPAVYVDQWVWVRLARARLGWPAHPDDVRVLDAVRRAAAAGVTFPLASVHYLETAAVVDPRQRADLAAVMAPVSRCVTIRGGRDLMRHQFLVAMHEEFGRQERVRGKLDRSCLRCGRIRTEQSSGYSLRSGPQQPARRSRVLPR